MPKLNLLPQRLPANIGEGIGRGVGALGVTPNMISLFAFAGNVLAAYLVTREALLWAGIIYLVFSLMDLVDGAVARAKGLASVFGAIFDSVLDRASEVLVVVGCAYYFAERGENVQVVVAYTALFGSVAVSYMRARAEAAGLSMREGLFRRQERVALVALGLLFNGLTVVIWLLAALSNATAVQRFFMLVRGLRETPATD